MSPFNGTFTPIILMAWMLFSARASFALSNFSFSRESALYALMTLCPVSISIVMALIPSWSLWTFLYSGAVRRKTVRTRMIITTTAVTVAAVHVISL